MLTFLKPEVASYSENSPGGQIVIGVYTLLHIRA